MIRSLLEGHLFLGLIINGAMLGGRHRRRATAPLINTGAASFIGTRDSGKRYLGKRYVG